VYRLAQECGLRGEVCNDGAGVLIRAIADANSLETFVQRLRQECPPLAKIEAIARSPLPNPPAYTDFTITQSIASTVHTAIASDAATCPQCKADVLDPFSRYFRYPFTNCTHCGPRLSIIRAIPYDRNNTSMAQFPMCPACSSEYHNIANRRFHAQPVACHVCGPSVRLERADGQPIVSNMFSMLDEVDAVCTLLQRGEIVAIKGIGGIHLACDATNETVVKKLRDRKHRYHKPFALMARELSIIEHYCVINDLERELLTSPAAPIVLLEKKREEMAETGDWQASSMQTAYPPIALSVAPHVCTLGFMLPYTPLHHLMLRRMQRPIVLTSGNLSDEPQCIDNHEASIKLSAIADYLLLHNREIVNRVDDSVVRVIADTNKPDPELKTPNPKLQILRRARGYAPAPLQLPAGFEQAPPVLAMGGELKNTFCLLQDGQAILSQHLGDLENAAVNAAYRDTLHLYLHLFQHQPTMIAIDLHPDYLSTKVGQELALTLANGNLPLQAIQHHHAHVAACMAENGLPLDTAPILGIALDGLGYGADGTLWGGEFLLADYLNYQRLGRFKPVAMLGGAQAIYQPWRNTYAHLLAAFTPEEKDLQQQERSYQNAWENLVRDYAGLELWAFLQQQPRSLLNQMLAKGLHSPISSSAGRLFDAVAAAMGIGREHASYEGQAAIELEALIAPEHLRQSEPFAYPFAIQRHHSTIPTLEFRPLWQALLRDLHHAVPACDIAARFHLGLAQAIATFVSGLHTDHAFTHIALTGGVFQNRILHEQVSQRLTTMGFTVLSHSLVPPNDGGLSLGQAAITAAKGIGVGGWGIGDRENGEEAEGRQKKG
jgi:hydrogenase maturation protein HypF